MKPFVSIIIPFTRVDDGLKECLERCAELDFRDFEIILLPDRKPGEDFPGARVFETGEIFPSAKRNIGIRESKGDILAFIDSDACPESDWLSKAVPFFSEGVAAAVGGPNLTKLSDSLLERAGGEVLSCFAGSGLLAARFGKGNFSCLEDLPACNLLVRKSDLEENGLLFDERLLTAEDSKLCFELKALGKRLVFSPEVVVRHHRRRLFGPHLRQYWNYGRDKGFLLRECFSTGKAYYLLPSAIVLYTAGGLALSALEGSLRPFFGATMSFYLLAAAFSGLAKNWRHSPLLFAGIVLTHYTYGIAFLCGLLSNKQHGMAFND